ncbi:MAG TPA: hypothetical protein VFN91_03420, partial [Myxococcaceae bacterium]|nr:hypothetical protein [Myxococcaceae bacterium]
MNRRVVCTLLPLLLAYPVLAGSPPPPPFAPSLPGLSPLERRGEHLVVIGGCHDCHTPKKLGPEGPVPDMTRMLSGHPDGSEVPSPPTLSGHWIIAIDDSFSAYSGPWGTS